MATRTHCQTASASLAERPIKRSSPTYCTSFTSRCYVWNAYKDHFISGGVALATSFAIMHPLDTLKTRAQANTLTTWLFTRETLQVVRKGFFTSVLGAGPQGGLRLATYELAKATFLIPPSQAYRQSQLKDPSLLMHFQTSNTIVASAMCAIMGDFVSSIVKVPREVITARLQTDHGATHQRPTTLSSVVRTILQEDGPKGLFRGFFSTTLRDWPFMVILFTTYESFKHMHLPCTSNESSQQPLTWSSTLFGGVSGALAGCLTTPFDVVKTRVMTFKKTSPNESVTMRSVVRQMMTEQGPSLRPFFTGGLARSTWWFCVCSMFFPIYENMKEALAS